MIDIIKEYLVSVGFHIDKKSFNDANKGFANLEKGMNKFTKALSGNKGFKTFADNLGKIFTALQARLSTFFKSAAGMATAGGAAIATAFLIATKALHGFMSSVAQADIEIQKFARRMLTTVENARSLQAVMKQMGIKGLEGLQDVAVNPELRSQFFALRRLSGGLGLGADEQQGLKSIRAFNFEFQKLGLITDLFFQKLGGYLGKFLTGPLKDLQKLMDSLNSFFARNADRIAQILAKSISSVYKLVQVLTKFLGLFLPAFRNMDSSLEGFLSFLDKGLDFINAILDATNALLDTFKKIPSSPLGMGESIGGGIMSGGILKTLTYYVQRIYELLTQIWNWVAGLFRMPGKWLNSITELPKSLWDFLTGGDKSDKKFDQNTLSYLLKAASDNKLRVTSTTGGTHNPGSLHPFGQAVDIDHRTMTKGKMAALRALGIRVVDERTHPRGQKEWSAPHYHLEFTTDQYQKMMQNKKGSNTTASVTQPVSIQINGVQDPMAIAAAVQGVLNQQAGIVLRNTQGAYA